MTVEDESVALSYLKSVGYYRLSGHWRLMHSRDEAGTLTDRFLNEASFQSAIEIWEFDRNLKSVVWEAIECVEVLMRTKLSYVIGEHHPLAHLDKEFLDGNFTKKYRVGRNGVPSKNTFYQEWLNKLNGQINSSQEPFVKRYKDQGEKLPIWVAAELFDFGQTSFLYAGLKHGYRAKVAASLGVHDQDLLKDWMRSINYLRNTIAHHSRLWNKNITQPPALPTMGNFPLLDHLWELPPTEWGLSRGHTRDERSRVYTLICVLAQLMEDNSPESQWGTSVMNLVSSFPESHIPFIGIEAMGFPDGWENYPIWASHKIPQPDIEADDIYISSGQS